MPLDLTFWASGTPGTPLRPSWDPLGPPWDPSWDPSWDPWDPLGPPWDPPGTPGTPGASGTPPGGVSGPFWTDLGLQKLVPNRSPDVETPNSGQKGGRMAKTRFGAQKGVAVG